MQGTTSNSIHQLHAQRKTFSHSIPSLAMAQAFVESALALIFPHYSGSDGLTLDTLEGMAKRATGQLRNLCAGVVPEASIAEQTARDFQDFLPVLHTALVADAHAILQGDPAARSVDEVIAAYPGFYATAVYRIGNWLYARGIPIVPRLLTEWAHRVTGIDIHPGATIGASFVIDHGTGIVIGETTVIADNVKIYQGVTLGGLSVDKSFADKKRHPTIEKDVVIYANATILGGKTIIGEGSVVGGNVWVTSSVPPHSRVYHKADNVVSSS